MSSPQYTRIAPECPRTASAYVPVPIPHPGLPGSQEPRTDMRAYAAEMGGAVATPWQSSTHAPCPLRPLTRLVPRQPDDREPPLADCMGPQEGSQHHGRHVPFAAGPAHATLRPRFVELACTAAPAPLRCRFVLTVRMARPRAESRDLVRMRLRLRRRTYMPHRQLLVPWTGHSDLTRAAPEGVPRRPGLPEGARPCQALRTRATAPQPWRRA